MSILVNNVKMPKNCEECPCSYWTEGAHHDYCQAVGYDTEIHYGDKDRPQWCPLIEIPPHGRLVDADALKSDGFCTIVCYTGTMPYEYTAMRIDDVPTIIEAKGRETDEDQT